MAYSDVVKGERGDKLVVLLRLRTQLSISDSSCFFIQVMFLVMLPLAFQAIGVQ